MFFDSDFLDQKSLRAIVERHGQVLFQPFDQEGLRVDSLHLEVDPNATFRMQPCRFIRSDILGPLKVMIDEFVAKGCSFPIFLVLTRAPWFSGIRRKGNQIDYREVNQFLQPARQPTSMPRYAFSAARWSALLCESR